jgi:hypothetical protein
MLIYGAQTHGALVFLKIFAKIEKSKWRVAIKEEL